MRFPGFSYWQNQRPKTEEVLQIDTKKYSLVAITAILYCMELQQFEPFCNTSLLQVVGRRALASCARPQVSTGWRIDAYGLQQRPAAAVQVHMATVQHHAAYSAYLPFFYSRGNMYKNYFTIFRALSAPVPFPHKVRYASGRKGFLGEFVDNLRQEFTKNQEMKDNIKKFREEAKRLEESDALQQARKKYVRVSF